MVLSSGNVFLCQTCPPGDLCNICYPPHIRELAVKLSSDWLSAGSNVVASESMIFVFEFIAKPFAYSSKRNFLSAFFHSLSCVDCNFCRLVLCFCVWPCFNHVVDPVWHQLLHLERLWRAAKISFVFPTFRFCPLTLQTSMDVTTWRLHT